MADPSLPPPAAAREPSLSVVRAPDELRRRFLLILRLTVAMVVFAGGTSVLAAGGRLGVPFEHVVTLRGRLASVGDLFSDPQVVRLLREHDLRVETVSAGSREVATGDLTPWDFAFPSGAPAADLIHDRRQGKYSNEPQPQPFDSPLVLATYRPYAEALVGADVASRIRSGEGMYYSLHMDKFLAKAEAGKTWRDIGLTQEKYGITNKNVVLANTSDICESNSADSYLALAAYTLGGGRVITGDGAAPLLRRVARVVLAQGDGGSDLFSTYRTDAGRGQAPVVVVYEHQYLRYQTDYRAAHGTVDNDRVLLYPDTPVVSQPHFIALSPKADRLGRLLVSDPALRRREAELGYRVNTGDDFSAALERERIPVPPTATDDHDETHTVLPDAQVLDQMITTIKPSCPTLVPH